MNILFNECRKHLNESCFTFDVCYENDSRIDEKLENIVKTFC